MLHLRVDALYDILKNSGVDDGRSPLDAHRVQRERRLGLDSTTDAVESLWSRGLASMLSIDGRLVDAEVLRTALAVHLAAVLAMVDILRCLHHLVAVSPMLVHLALRRVIVVVVVAVGSPCQK